MDVIEPVYNLLFIRFVPTYHVHLQVLMGLVLLYVLLKKSGKEGRNSKIENELDIINNWQPEPLVQPMVGHHRSLTRPVTKEQIGKHITVTDFKCLNFATHNYLCFVNDEKIEAKAVAAIRKYGIGSCGPRGFFGTVDVHLELEEKLAAFMKTEAAVLYSYGFSTIASAIPAYAKRGDIVFADEAVNFPIQKGLAASRSHIKYFRHNDVQHLEELLEEQTLLDRKNPRKAAKTRKFLVVEGIYHKTGEICPLPELMKLKNLHKLRLFIDESISFGTLGRTGRGVTEHFKIPVEDIDMIMSTMEASLGSIGGFCVGTTFVVEHQVLSGLGYCFSASLPPFLTVAATTALTVIDENPILLEKLKNNCNEMQDLLQKSAVVKRFFNVSGFLSSPVKHLFPLAVEDDIFDRLDAIVNQCLTEGVAFTVPAFNVEDKIRNTPSIRITLNWRFELPDLTRAVSVLEKASLSVFETGS